MLNANVIISFILGLVFVLLGLAVFYRNPKESLNRIYLLFSFSIAAWLITNYLGSSVVFNNTTSLFINRAVFITGLITITLLFLFVWVLAEFRVNKYVKTLVAVNVLMALALFGPWVVEAVRLENNTYAIIFGPLALLYFCILFLSFGLTIGSLIVSYLKSKNQKKQQVGTLLTTLMLVLTIILLTNALLPFFLNYYNLTNAGTFLSSLMVVAIGYSMARHRLFDIRLLVARALAYASSLAMVALIYAVLVVVIAKYMLGINLDQKSEIILAIFSAITAIAFQPFKKQFDKITTKLFYHDSYDTQELINNVNSTLVQSTDLYKLLSETAENIKKIMKVEMCNFYIDEKSSLDFHLVGTETKLFADPRWQKLISFQEATNKKTITDTDDLDAGILEHMRDLKVGNLQKMISQDQNVGYLVTGQKKSGNAYSDKDVQILEIIADEVAIAVQNTLRFEEIAQFNVTLQKRIQDATAQLQKTNEKLVALDEAKDEFISMASHQLRTPLTSIKGYLSMLQEGDAGDLNEQQHNFVDQAFLSSQRMVYLIADLLNVSRLKTGKFVIEAKPTYLPDVVEGELAQLTETVKARGLELVYDKPAEFPTMNLDETKVRQVIMNFADNAIYYTPNGGKITIELKADENNVTYTVTDTGIGVPKSEQHKLFTKFYRAGNARKARPDGTGLGLFMAKKVVVAQGGAIIFKTQEGKGSTFGFSFPRARLEIKEPAPRAEEPALV